MVSIPGLIRNAFKSLGNILLNGIKTAILNPITNNFTKLFSVIASGFNRIFGKITDIIKTITTLFNCLMAFFIFISELFKYIFNFCIWLFIYFLPWLGQYFECAFEKIVSLPKCFFWYILECISWVVYLPFRIVFWLIDYLFNIGLEQLIHDYFWCILEDIDKFIHDEGEGSLGTGIHIIHFPDSVMDKCYNCHIKPIGKKMPSTCNLNKKYCKFINCKNGNKCISTKCNAQINQYMEKPKSEGDTETNM